MWYTYVLKSINQNKFYVGHTDNTARRLQQHNQGKSTYTKRFIPWKIVYVEQFPTKDEAIHREKYLKSASGRRWQKKNISHIDSL